MKNIVFFTGAGISKESGIINVCKGINKQTKGYKFYYYE